MCFWYGMVMYVCVSSVLGSRWWCVVVFFFGIDVGYVCVLF